MSVSANAAPLYSSVFNDNGYKVTEVRTFGDSSVETWEWLDLTVTNGISFNSLVADLADDSKLNNSSALLANTGALTDVEGLLAVDQTNWETQTDQDIVNLFSNFFSLALRDDIMFSYRANVDIVEEFIFLFGDAYSWAT